MKCEKCRFYNNRPFGITCSYCIRGGGITERFSPINREEPPKQPTKPPMPPVNPPKDEINHPDRYAGGKFECIEVMADVFGKDAVKHFCLLNAFKYIWRQEKKGGVEDIKKAMFYMDYYIKLTEEENETDK